MNKKKKINKNEKDNRKFLCKTIYLNNSEQQVVEEIGLFVNLFWVMNCPSFYSDYIKLHQ